MIPISVAHSWFGGKLGSQTKAVVWRVPKPGSQNWCCSREVFRDVDGFLLDLLNSSLFWAAPSLVGQMEVLPSMKMGKKIDSPSSPISPFFSLWAVNTPRCLAVVTSDHTILHGTSVSTHMTELWALRPWFIHTWHVFRYMNLHESGCHVTIVWAHLIITLRQGQSQFGEISRYCRHPGSPKRQHRSSGSGCIN